MEAGIMIAIGGFIFQIFVFLGGAYYFILQREAKVIDKMDAMHKDQDGRIEKAETEAKAIRENYNTKFQRVHDTIHETKVSIIESMHAMENNLRDSNHTLAENVTKALNRLEMIVKGAK